MKKLLLPLLLSVVALCGCTHTYVMKLSNGMVMTTPGKPKLRGSYYHFKDATGKEHLIPQSRVTVIEPASLAAEEDKVPKYRQEKRHWWQFWR